MLHRRQSRQQYIGGLMYKTLRPTFSWFSCLLAHGRLGGTIAGTTYAYTRLCILNTADVCVTSHKFHVQDSTGSRGGHGPRSAQIVTFMVIYMPPNNPRSCLPMRCLLPKACPGDEDRLDTRQVLACRGEVRGWNYDCGMQACGPRSLGPSLKRHGTIIAPYCLPNITYRSCKVSDLP